MVTESRGTPSLYSLRKKFHVGLLLKKNTTVSVDQPQPLGFQSAVSHCSDSRQQASCRYASPNQNYCSPLSQYEPGLLTRYYFISVVSGEGIAIIANNRGLPFHHANMFAFARNPHKLGPFLFTLKKKKAEMNQRLQEEVWRGVSEKGSRCDVGTGMAAACVATGKSIFFSETDQQTRPLMWARRQHPISGDDFVYTPAELRCV